MVKREKENNGRGLEGWEDEAARLWGFSGITLGKKKGREKERKVGDPVTCTWVLNERGRNTGNASGLSREKVKLGLDIEKWRKRGKVGHGENEENRPTQEENRGRGEELELGSCLGFGLEDQIGSKWGGWGNRRRTRKWAADVRRLGLSAGHVLLVPSFCLAQSKCYSWLFTFIYFSTLHNSHKINKRYY